MTSCTITLLVPADLSTLRESPGFVTMGDMAETEWNDRAGKPLLYRVKLKSFRSHK
jgi:hypothetical protein